jgi:lysine biosynthesis protein LysW
MANGYCTECAGNIKLEKKTRKGQIVLCHKCGARMVVVNLSPIELDLTFNEDSGGWDNYDYYLEFDHERINRN